MAKKKNKRRIKSFGKTLVLLLPQITIGYFNLNYYYVFTNYISPKLTEAYGDSFIGSDKYVYATFANLIIGLLYIILVIYYLKKGKKLSPYVLSATFTLQLFLFYITSLLHGILVVSIVAVL